jgi:hypothetical protein
MFNEMKSRFISVITIKLMAASFIILLYGFLNNINADWVQVSNGIPGNLPAASLAFSGNNIFVGFSVPYGVYVSTNNGTSWTSTSLPGYTVLSLAASGNNILTGTEGNGVFLSTNNGTIWTQTSLNNRTVNSLAINGSNIFAGTNNNFGVYRSTNNGLNWTQTILNNLNIPSLGISGNNIFAGSAGTGVYLSTNNGLNWTQTPFNDRVVLSLAVNGNNIFAGTAGQGVYLSTDNGATWTQTSLNDRNISSLAVNGNNIFAGDMNGNGVYVSNDNGTNWTMRFEGFPGPIDILTLCIFNNYIFAGSDFWGIYRRPLSELIGIKPISNEVPNQFSLSQNYPNPFNPKTVISFQIAASSFASLKIYDILGREAAILVNEFLKPGTYEADWSADNFASGIYYYKLMAGDYIGTRKMVLVK